MKRATLSMAIVLCMILALLTGCGSPNQSGGDASTPASQNTAAGGPSSESPAASGGYTGEALTVRFATSNPPPPALSAEFYMFFEDKVTELSGGKITFENYWGGSLLKAAEMLEGLQSGIVDIAQGIPVVTAGKTPLAVFTFAFPFKPSDVTTVVEAAREVWDTVPALAEELHQYNIKMLAIQSAADYAVLSKKPIYSMEDLNGLKIAAAGDYLPKLLSVTGATAVAMPGSERYEALETGVIDASIMDIGAHVGDKLYEPCQYYVRADFGSAAVIYLFINEEFWNSLTQEQQAIFSEAAAYAEEQHLQLTLDTVAAYEQVLADNGIEIVELSGEEKLAWINAMPDIPAEWAASMESAYGDAGWEILRAFYTACEERGYVWPRDWGLF